MGLCRHRHSILIFFLSLTASWEIYSLSLHDALPISKFPFSVARVVSASARMKEGAALWEAESALGCGKLTESCGNRPDGPWLSSEFCCFLLTGGSAFIRPQQ